MGIPPRLLIRKSLQNENRNNIPFSVNPGTRMAWLLSSKTSWT